jgi:hypothetical protein
MSKNVTLVVMACAALASGISKAAYAQSTVFVPVQSPPPRIAAERSVLPNPALLSSGVGALTVSYVPSVIVAMISDHKADDNLYIPVAGPWLSLANRGCSGPTVLTESGPLEISSGRNCGTSGIEGFFLVADGILQGVGALGIVGAFLVPERMAVVAEQRPPSFAIAPSSLGGRGAGAMAVGSF